MDGRALGQIGGMIVTRFAPSPTGHLHWGHGLSAAFAARAARDGGGRFLLRIEDIDQTRCRDEFVQAIKDDLAWLGLAWEEPVRQQSRHFDEYARALDRLRRMDLLYPCFCTRADIAREIAAAGGAPHGADGAVYPGLCRGLKPDERARRMAAGEPHAWRLDMARALEQAGPGLTWRDLRRGVQHVADADLVHRLGDAVLARKECPTSYHLAVVHDDALQGVTLVTRGEDLFEATHLHRLLQHLLGWPTPEYCHHGLARDGAGDRLAKRKNAPSLRDLRAQGLTPQALWARLDEI